MNEGWLCDSILNAAHQPSPRSTTPAFSPGGTITRGPVVGRRFRCMREDLYEQCSDHMTEKIPSSAKLGSRPSSSFIRSYSSWVRLWAEITSGVIIGKYELCALHFALCYSKHQVQSTKHFYCPSPFLETTFSIAARSSAVFTRPMCL